MDYKEIYEKEHLKNVELAERIAELEMQNDELKYKLGRIQGNPLWKVSKPFRLAMHWAIRQKHRLQNCGGVKGVMVKLDYKKREKAAMKQFGTESYPSEQEADAERTTVFERMVKISILVPLYNTPIEFLYEMIDSVVNQTYENW